MSTAAWLLRVAYDGGALAGFQAQRGGGVRTVAGCLERALEGLVPGGAAVVGSSRTDAGVHATGGAVGVVAHDLPRDEAVLRRPPAALSAALNARLRRNGDADVLVTGARLVPPPPAFHPRHSAVGRTYHYLVVASALEPLPTEAAGRAWWLVERAPLDVQAMRDAAGRLVGTHDFSSFRGAGCQASGPIRRLSRLAVQNVGAGALDAAGGGAAATTPVQRLVVTAEAPSFLYRQVRSLVGTLVAVGAGRSSPEDVDAFLAARTPAALPPRAPPHGLYLADVAYPPCAFGEGDGLPAGTETGAPPAGWEAFAGPDG